MSSEPHLHHQRDPVCERRSHLGHALEFVQADVLARHRRLRGDEVRYLSGTDDNALKNVDAALAAGVPVAEFVSEKAERFAALAGPSQVSNDDFIRTSTDPRHRPGVERLWAACAKAGDLYERDYEGLYCQGCEAFVLPTDLRGGRCPEHAEQPERIVERNWFFRLSRYQDSLLELLESAGCTSSLTIAGTRWSRSSEQGSPTSACHARRSARVGGASRCRATPARSSTSGSTRSPTTSRLSASARMATHTANGGVGATSGCT
jgi:hypothetical protein